MKAAHRKAFISTFYDEDLKCWVAYYKRFNKPSVAGEGKTPEAARADLIEKIRHETIPNNRR